MQQFSVHFHFIFILFLFSFGWNEWRNEAETENEEWKIEGTASQTMKQNEREKQFLGLRRSDSRKPLELNVKHFAAIL